MTTYPGIDYGMGQTNRDPETGLRFGVLSANDLAHWFYDELEADYGAASCPECGAEAEECDDDRDLEYRHIGGCHDYACETCEVTFDSSYAFPEEPLAQTFNRDGYQGFLDSENDVWLTKSPYFTNAQFCSPCAPGAGHLGNPCENGPRTYCFGHKWFEGGVAPYPVFDVQTGKEVLPDARRSDPE